MNVRKTRRLLWFTATLLMVGAGGVLALAFALPLSNGDGATVDVAAAASPVQNQSEGKSLSPADLEPLWKLNLRRPLYDPPKAVITPAPPPPPPPALTVRLVGTVVEPPSGGKSNTAAAAQAMFVNARGQLEIKQPGEMVGESPANEGARILTIEPDIVTVRYLGKDLQLKLEEQASP